MQVSVLQKLCTLNTITLRCFKACIFESRICFVRLTYTQAKYMHQGNDKSNEEQCSNYNER
eukprot:scaffold122318_cov19-Tisochrysis_lutea.AAC.1